MKIIIVGVGKVGETLVENFTREKHDIVVIEKDRTTLENIVNLYDVRGILGNGIENTVLEDAGAREADFLIACTSRDEMNILLCTLAKKMGAKHTIARVRDPEYYNEMETVHDQLGLDFAFNPELRTAIEIKNVLKFPSAKNVESFAGNRALIVEFSLENGNPIIGKTIMEISKDYSNSVLFGVVERDGKAYIPKGDFVLAEKDSIHVIGSEKNIIDFAKKLKIFKPAAKSVMMIGGGRVAFYLAKELLPTGVDVKIIEIDIDRCEKLSEMLTEATVICGDGTDQAVLDEEGIKSVDATVTITGLDESNIMVSLYAKQKNVDKVITKINRMSLTNMVKTLGLDTVFSPRKAIANHIIGFVRAHKTDATKGVNTFYKLCGNAEALEFVVDGSNKKLGIPLKKLKIKNNALIGGIVRGKDFVLPTGDTVMKEGDKVIIITTIEGVTELSQVFK